MANLRSSVFGWKSVWMDLAEETNGQFAEGPHGTTVRVPMEQTPWTVTIKLIEHGPKKQTVIAVPFKADKDFSFAVHNKTWIEEVAKPFGLQDIEIGDQQFDAEYIIKGNNVELVKELLTADGLKDLIWDQKHVRLAIHKDTAQLAQYGSVPAGIHVLSLVEDSAINSFERLAGLRELLRATLYELNRIGVAAKANPGFVI
jgi:hypothetical protein